MTTKISSLPQLLQALATNQPQTLELQTALISPESITLPPGYALTGAAKDRCSFSHGDGLGLTADNLVQDLSVLASPASRAIFACAGRADMDMLYSSRSSVQKKSAKSAKLVR